MTEPYEHTPPLPALARCAGPERHRPRCFPRAPEHFGEMLEWWLDREHLTHDEFLVAMGARELLGPSALDQALAGRLHWAVKAPHFFRVCDVLNLSKAERRMFLVAIQGRARS